MRNLFLILILGYLAACGSSRQAAAPVVTPATIPFASGPVMNACVAADRSNASRRLCGCVQAVANDSLTSSDQSRAVGFFRDPQKAQDARGGSAFWTRYRAFSNRAAKVCAAS
ncbi:MAG: hypothetical protein ACPG5U_04400 [Planktomarina sp.]